MLLCDRRIEMGEVDQRSFAAELQFRNTIVFFPATPTFCYIITQSQHN